MEGRNAPKLTEEQTVYFVQPNAGSYFIENRLSELFDNLAKVNFKPDQPQLFTKLEDINPEKLSAGIIKISIPTSSLMHTGNEIKLREPMKLDRQQFLGVYFFRNWSRNNSIGSASHSTSLDPENSHNLFDFYQNIAEPKKQEITEDVVRQQFNHVLQTLRMMRLPTAKTHISALPPELIDQLYREHIEQTFEYPKGMKIPPQIIDQAKTAFISQEILKDELETWKKLGTRGLPAGIDKMYKLLEGEAKKTPGTRIKARDLAQRIAIIAQEQAGNHSRGRNQITQKFYDAIAKNDPKLLLEVADALRSYRLQHQTTNTSRNSLFNVFSRRNAAASRSINTNETAKNKPSRGK